MEAIGNFTQNYQVKKTGILGPRHEMIVMFTETLNECRKNTKYKPLSFAAVASKLKHVPTGDLYPFYRKCQEAKNFSSYFFWSLKI